MSSLVFIVIIVSGSLITLYIIGVLFTTVLQEKFLFRPRRLADDFKFDSPYPFEEVLLKRPDGARIHALHFKAENPRGIIVYFHGNAGALDRWQNVAPLFVERGWDLLISDYRTFGKSRGKITEDAIHADALAWYEKARTWFPEEKIIIYGRSIGSGPASKLATCTQAKMLILETPFHSIKDLFHTYYPFLPPIFPFKIKFLNAKNIQKLNIPVHIFSGTRDRVTPLGTNRRLVEAAADRVEWHLIQNGKHQNLFEFIPFQNQMNILLGPKITSLNPKV